MVDNTGGNRSGIALCLHIGGRHNTARAPTLPVLGVSPKTPVRLKHKKAANITSSMSAKYSQNWRETICHCTEGFRTWLASNLNDFFRLSHIPINGTSSFNKSSSFNRSDKSSTVISLSANK